MAGRIRMKHFGSAEMLAKVIAFLASDAASFVTDVVLLVYGGYLTTAIDPYRRACIGRRA